jgi:hypothetical protein
MFLTADIAERAHTRSRRRENLLQRKRHCVCTVYPVLLDSACLDSGPSQTPQPSALNFTCTPAFFFWSSQRKKKSFFVLFFVSQVHFFLPIVSRPSAHIFYRRSFAPRIRKLIRRAYVFKLHILQYLQSSRRALGLGRDQTYIHLPTIRSIL